MAQQNDGDLSSKFSTLNVNAMEFVPSFCLPAAPSAAEEDVSSEEPSPTVESAPAEPKSAAETPTDDVAAITATPTQTADDKTPENQGEILRKSERKG